MINSAKATTGQTRMLWRRARRLVRRSQLRIASIAAALALVALILPAIGTLSAVGHQDEAAAAINRTLQVLDASFVINADLTGAMVEARGYLVDHASEHRARYESAARATQTDIGRLVRQFAAQPDLTAQTDLLRSLITARLYLVRDIMDHAAPRPDTLPAGAPRTNDDAQELRLAHARPVSEAYAAVMARLVDQQRQHLAQQEAAMRAATRGTLLGLSLCAICLALCLTLTVVVRARTVRRLRRLHRSNGLLQGSVRRRTAAVVASEAKLRTYLMHLADGLSVIRVGADGSFAFEEMNAAARLMLDLGDRDVIGLAPHEIYRDAAPGAIESRLHECVQAETPIRYNKTLVTRRGRRELRISVAPVRGQPTPAHPQGRIELLLQSLRDVTGEAEREERLRQGQRVEAVGRLTAGVAHDFNNLLQALMGGLELALPEVADRPEAADSIQMALAAARRGAQLTSQLLSFSGQQILRPISLDLAQPLHDLARTLERTLGHDIRVEVAVAPGLPPALVDPAHLGSALLNLALNARDAMPDGGTLQITAFAAGAELVVAVADTGTGMSPEVLARASEPFFTTKGIHGTGLGLSMAHGFARQSGGDLRIHSRPGQGTRVEIVLLPAAAKARPERPGLVEAPRHGAGRILIVDDESDVRQVTSAFLRKAGFEVVAARDADVALSLLAAGPRFDALVTDYAMAGMNGVDLVLQAREISPGQPALIITGYAGAEGLRWLPPDVMTLRKPFTRADFVDAVMAVIDAVAATPAPTPAVAYAAADGPLHV
jgi:signal transduction histidine kinase/CHASE3 domain sensor protein